MFFHPEAHGVFEKIIIKMCCCQMVNCKVEGIEKVIFFFDSCMTFSIENIHSFKYTCCLVQFSDLCVL